MVLALLTLVGFASLVGATKHDEDSLSPLQLLKTLKTLKTEPESQSHYKLTEEPCSASYIKAHLKTRRERCEYVKLNCTSEGVLDYYRIYYCAAQREHGNTVWGQVVFFAGLAVGLAVLFRVLGTTADDYFAPTLTELCREMGLPPRFAGVTFLALASGAPDVSSTFAAVRGGDYELALGALSGAAMFVTCVVGGSVILVGNGAKCRGALCRDITMLVSTSCLVLYVFVRGTMHKSQSVLFVILYFAFALIVLIADVYHRRKVIIPAVKTGSRMMARRLSVSFSSRARSTKGLVDDMGAVLMAEDRPRRPSETELVEQDGVSETESETEDSDSDEGWKRQNMLYKQSMFRAIEGEGWEMRAGAGEEDEGEDDMDDMADYLPLVDGTEKLQEPLSDKAMISPKEFFFQFYHKSHESIHALVHKVRHEGWAFFRDETTFNKVVFILEIPFTVARTLTIPAVDGEMYFKPFFVASCTGLPVWVLFNVAGSVTGAPWPAQAATAVASVALGAAMLVCAPRDRPPLLKFGTKFPFGLAVICLVSFILAALWISLVATELVSIITFMGSITAIDPSILGLTVIAWGNSIGDYSSNLAMAKRGLGNVSMTASFAGPVFNILIGLGFGFLFYFNLSGTSVKPVEISPVTALALVCIAFNGICMIFAGVFNDFHVPRRYGWVPIAVYALYIAGSTVLIATGATLPVLHN